jgi:hypothetical protein
MSIVIQQFDNTVDGTFSHYSLVEIDAYGEIVELATCVMHDSIASAEAELTTLYI